MAKGVKFSVRSNVIIIGTGLSGLVTGAALARGGRKVTVLQDEGGPEEKALQIPFLPQLLSIGFERDSPVERIFNELGISLSLLRRSNDLFKKIPAWLQIISSNFRFTLYGERDETLADLRAGLGERNVLPIKRLFEQLDEWSPLLVPYLYEQGIPRLQRENWLRPFLSWAGYRIKVSRLSMQNAFRYCKELGLDEVGLDYLNALTLFQSGETLQQISTLDLFRLLLFLKQEPLSTAKSFSGQKELFLKIIRENKGEIKAQSPSALAFLNGRIAGVEFQGKEGIGCDHLIWNPEKRGLQSEKENMVFQSYFELDENAIPSAMGEFLILKRKPELPLDRTNFMYLSMAMKSSPESKEIKGKSTLRGLVVHIPLASGMSQPNEKELNEEIVNRLIWLMPFAENNLKHIVSRISRPETRYPEYFPPQTVRKADKLQKKPCSVITLGKSFYYLPHPANSFLNSSFLIKRGYDLAVSLKLGN
jgi:hypothetical protein